MHPFFLYISPQPLDSYIPALLCFFSSLLPLYCLCRQQMTRNAPMVIREVKCEYISITTAVLRHAESVMRLRTFFFSNLISLCVTAVHCAVCDIALPQGTFEVTAPPAPCGSTAQSLPIATCLPRICM